MNSNVSSDSPSGGASTGTQQLVTYFVDRARQVNGTSPPKRVIGTIAKELAALAKEGHSDDLVLTAIDILVDKGLDPTQIASCVFTAQARMRGGITRDDVTMLSEFLAEAQRLRGIRWPTGSRFVRSVAAGQYVPDPLGLDKPTYDVPWSPPSKPELIQALRERKAQDAADSGTPAGRPAPSAQGSRP